MSATAGGSRVFMTAPATARRMTEAASRFLATLDQSRLSAASFAFTDNGAAMALIANREPRVAGPIIESWTGLEAPPLVIRNTRSRIDHEDIIRHPVSQHGTPRI